MVEHEDAQRTGRVRANTSKSEQPSLVRRNSCVLQLSDRASKLNEPFRPAFEPKGPDQAPYRSKIGRSERTRIWILAHEGLVDGDDLSRKRPAEQQFGDKHPVRVNGFPPREAAAVQAGPVQQATPEPSNVLPPRKAKKRLHESDIIWGWHASIVDG